ncbi:uncharacterized protein MKK02DRAFT_39007 [Dioszegia hungarica]|uniref:(S)-ureidoglycine aminohydrolase cupin domain-containing protein n=1 Tax=Dioszegia hungarica TaxID=4972 RepID=A0AA38H5B6_9TREE|nr:uncharacterized protein MKK02DRAFT_39007 [Dioszegia hungarica]KAI9634330.1 hypothetical protein MKK02DRAFT_39007 [Dioszegia hungarica]
MPPATSPQIRHFKSTDKMALNALGTGTWVTELGTTGVKSEYTGGMFEKDATSDPVNNKNGATQSEWKYIISGEWHIRTDTGKDIIARVGDVVFVPKGAIFSSSPSPFRAFFVASRSSKPHLAKL